MDLELLYSFNMAICFGIVPKQSFHSFMWMRINVDTATYF